VSGFPRLSERARRVDLIQSLHASTARDYVGRVTAHDKAECASVARRFDADYWDGERRFGYGGYRYDGRWRSVAEELVARYALGPGKSLLDVGCGKGFLLYELLTLVPELKVCGLDVSAYAIEHAKPEIAGSLLRGDAAELPFPDRSFDCVISLATLHNLPIAALFAALGEITRVLRDPAQAYVMVESYRSEREKMNLLYWQLTCASFYAVSDWEWVFERAGYAGDYGFIFFE
jgi:SAM-dependent methyltransferase